MSRSPSTPTNDKPPCAPFHSHPSDLELVKSYLRPWVDSGVKVGTFTHVDDVYSAEPAILTRNFAPAVAQDGERAWYFLTPLRPKSKRGKRKARTVATGEGWWHGEAKPKPVVDVLDGRRHVGYRQSFSFLKMVGGRGTRMGWIMLELRLESGQEEDSDGSLALCKVYRSPRHPGEPPSPATPAARKRKADGDDESSASPRPMGKADDDEGSSAATVAAPTNADDEIPDTAAAPGRKKEADNDDSAETSAAAPGSKRKAAGDESSVAASAAEPARSKRKADGKLHCPHCGGDLDAEAVLAAAKSKSETKSETGIVHVEGDHLVKDHTFYQFF